MNHLLVLRFSSMGDVAMTIPSLRCLIKKYPETKITVVSKSTFRPFFKEFKNLDFFEVNFKTKHKGLKGVFRLFKELTELKPTHIADLHSVLRTHVLYVLFKFKLYNIKRVDKSRAERKKLFRKNNKIFKPLTPAQYRYSEVFNRLGFNIDLSNHEFSDPYEITSQDQIAHIDKSKKWIGIAPFASFNGKIYPLDLMQNIVSFLQRDHQVFLFGNGVYETKKLEIWEKAFQNVFGCYNLKSLEKEIEIISNLDLMISMDSANGHIAANYNVPVITLWGLTHPFAGFAPFLSASENMLVSNREKYPLLPTSAYGKKIPKGYESVMRTIEYKEVIVRALKSLEQSTRHHSR